MNQELARVSVRILEKDYHVACPMEERAALLDSAEFLSRKMKEIRDTGKVVGLDRIAVMAALNIAHELLSMKVGAGFDIGDAKRRITSIEAKLDAAIAQQEKLF